MRAAGARDRRPWVLAGLCGALSWGGCTPSAPAVDAGRPRRVVDAAVPDAPPPPPPRKSGIPLPSGETAWGVAIPLGCTPVYARPTWIEARCRLSADALRRFFAFRFPAGRLRTLGRGDRFDPGVTGAGHAILTPFRGPDGVRSKLLVFVGAEPDDPGAVEIVERLAPAALR